MLLPSHRCTKKVWDMIVLLTADPLNISLGFVKFSHCNLNHKPDEVKTKHFLLFSCCSIQIKLVYVRSKPQKKIQSIPISLF